MILRDYQLSIAERAHITLCRYNAVYLCMQTRTGKTLTALHTISMYGAKNVLFVTKKKAIKSIEGDFYKCDYDYNLTVVNYESVHKIEGKFDLIVCDEAHAMGMYPKPSLRAKQMKKIAKDLPIIYLSATPSPESYSQLFHQLGVSSFSPLRQYASFYKFAKDYVNVQIKHMYNREIKDYSNCDKQKLWKAINHIFISYTQKEAGFDISVTEKILTVPMPENLYQIIKKINKDNIYLDNGLEIVADTAVKVMQKTHQLCSGTVIDENGYNILSTFKVDYIKDHFKDQKIAIFYKFKSEFEMLKIAFENYTDIAEEFQKGIKDVFLGQFVSSREGIRLDAADSIIFLNIDFSFLSYEQARNRIASFERKESAVLYWIFSDKGIEKEIHKKVMNKENYTLEHYKKTMI